jgi:hypothetical protein
MNNKKISNYVNTIDKSDYYLDYLNQTHELIQLNKDIRKDGDKITKGFVPTILENDNFIICLKNKITHKICSFIHFSIRQNFSQYKKIIFINYSYTFISFRKQRLNSMLRLVLEDACKLNNIDAIVSVPFPESESRIVMGKLGYSNVHSDIFIKSIE